MDPAAISRTGCDTFRAPLNATRVCCVSNMYGHWPKCGRPRSTKRSRQGMGKLSAGAGCADCQYARALASIRASLLPCPPSAGGHVQGDVPAGTSPGCPRLALCAHAGIARVPVADGHAMRAWRSVQIVA